MDFFDIMNQVLYFVSYVYLAWLAVYQIADHESAIAIYVSDKVRVALLIFSFKWPKISVLAVVYQVCNYIILSFYLATRLRVVYDFVFQRIPNLDVIYTGVVHANLFGLFLIAMAEELIYYLRVVRKHPCSPYYPYKPYKGRKGLRRFRK